MNPAAPVEETPSSKAAEVAALVQLACLTEASVAKPGNVSPAAGFADVVYQDFVLSALAIGPAFMLSGSRPLGEVVLRAVRDTRAAVRTNTNLGLVLLLAPLAMAAAREGRSSREGRSLRRALSQVLSGVTLDDARLVYEAIRTAQAGGLGAAADHDVAEPQPKVDLAAAMRLAAGRDSVAREYSTDFELTFELVVPVLRNLWAQTLSPAVVVAQAFLMVLAKEPDTLIARKRGRAAAEAVSAEAKSVLDLGGYLSERGKQAAARFDRRLRSEGNALNPGTTADLLGAGLFVLLREDPAYAAAVRREILNG